IDLAGGKAHDGTNTEIDTFKNIENATGSSDVDTITGTALANVLDGGAGADTLIGGAGNDTYVVDNAGDVVTEAAGTAGGIDLVKSWLGTYTLADNVENLTLLAGAVEGIGNGLNNIITGNNDNNKLDGGAGTDTLIGGGGDDIYTVDLVAVSGVAKLQDTVT